MYFRHSHQFIGISGRDQKHDSFFTSGIFGEATNNNKVTRPRQKKNERKIPFFFRRKEEDRVEQERFFLGQRASSHGRERTSELLSERDDGDQRPGQLLPQKVCKKAPGLAFFYFFAFFLLIFGIFIYFNNANEPTYLLANWPLFNFLTLFVQ